MCIVYMIIRIYSALLIVRESTPVNFPKRRRDERETVL